MEEPSARNCTGWVELKKISPRMLTPKWRCPVSPGTVGEERTNQIESRSTVVSVKS